jgi:hypothetical protein
VQEELHPQLRVDPSWFTDPPPPFMQLIRDFDPAQRLKVAGILIDTHIAIAEARIAGMKQIRELVASSRR